MSKQEEKNMKAIRDLMQQPDNKKCADCNTKGPVYVSTNFNTFICTNCSGIHRENNFRVKSVSMATFKPEEVKALQQGGNRLSNGKYLAKWSAKDGNEPDSTWDVDQMRAFIKKKYVEKRWLGESDLPPVEPLTNILGKNIPPLVVQPSSSNFSQSRPSAAPPAQNANFFDAFDAAPAPQTKKDTGAALFDPFSPSSSNSNSVKNDNLFDFDVVKPTAPSGTPFDPIGNVHTSPTQRPPTHSQTVFEAFGAAPPSSHQKPPPSSTPFSDFSFDTPSHPTPAPQANPFDLGFSSPKAPEASPFDSFGSPAPRNTSAPATSNLFDGFGSSAPTSNAASSFSFDSFESAPQPKSTPAPTSAPASNDLFDSFGPSNPPAKPAPTGMGLFDTLPSPTPKGSDPFSTSFGSPNQAKPTATPASASNLFSGFETSAASLNTFDLHSPFTNPPAAHNSPFATLGGNNAFVSPQYSSPQPSAFVSQQPAGFGSQQPAGFGSQQPAGFGSQQPAGFGSQQPAGFGSQQPAGFGSQQPSFASNNAPFSTNNPSAFGGLSVSEPSGFSSFGMLTPQEPNPLFSDQPKLEPKANPNAFASLVSFGSAAPKSQGPPKVPMGGLKAQEENPFGFSQATHLNATPQPPSSAPTNSNPFDFF
ncbi:ArfGAP with FG repeats 2-like [Planoprotostelium fungivorum]|uniref:ArfGAP with FG repeats 2-like n=1 Tax=Planoprotostelium fungivorum TaxID=1890364 RepID=A0A2P6P0F9_9EUKA|nr:ArfGAP with FG repeats 2-like [Planoprotostelium fungivorum]